MVGRANLRKKEKTNGLLAAINRGQGDQPKEKRKNKWISRGLKQGAGAGQPKEKRKRMDQ